MKDLRCALKFMLFIIIMSLFVIFVCKPVIIKVSNLANDKITEFGEYYDRMNELDRIEKEVLVNVEIPTNLF